jgi:hypothetical protein
MMIETEMSLDTVKFLKKTVDSMKSSVSFAYPGNALNYDRAHTSLQGIKSKLHILEMFLDSLQEHEKSTIPK